MMPYITDFFGNPSSTHAYGVKTRMAIEKAREQVAAMLNCQPYEIVFTGGGTESNNMAVKGAAYALKDRGKHIIISAVEHPAVTEVADFLAKNGFEISVAGVGPDGRVNVDELESLIKPGTILISVMHANNETGTIQPIKEISVIAKKHKILFHTDAAQSVGKIPVDVNQLGVDLLSIAGHKLYAPKGVGALFIRRGVRIEKYMHGASHENDMRPGTENVPYIVALGKAAELVNANLEEYAFKMKSVKQKLLDRLGVLPDMRINGSQEHCLPNTLNISFKNLSAADIIARADGVALSAGAACHSSGGKVGTLEAMHLPPEYSFGALRLSTGRHTTSEEVDEAADLIINAVEEQRGKKDDASRINDNKRIKITQYSHGMGCGCKMRPADLEEILKDLPVIISQDVVVSAGNRDDAAVYRVGKELIVQTVDFFTPMIDDPYAFGAIAAANALSDIYAMGAVPLFALNLVAFPVDELPLDILREIMRGASDKAAEAGIPILGGHSIEDKGIKFGMVVTGKVEQDGLITNSGARCGDALVLTKPLGSGIMSKALSLKLAGSDEMKEAMAVMMQLNKTASEIMAGFHVNACTDITGFGITGHLHEMTSASSVDAELWFDMLPMMNNVPKLAALGAIPGSSRDNVSFAINFTDFTTLNDIQKIMVCDAQTSGGLLVSLPATNASAFIQKLADGGISASEIGKITATGEGKITVRFKD